MMETIFTFLVVVEAALFTFMLGALALEDVPILEDLMLDSDSDARTES